MGHIRIAQDIHEEVGKSQSRVLDRAEEIDSLFSEIGVHVM